RPHVAFLVSGSGTPSAATVHALCERNSTFRTALLRCEEVLTRDLGFSRLREMLSPGEGDQLDPDGRAHLDVFCFEFALAEMLRSWGVVPDAVLGHGVGDYSAACAAGIFGLEDALRLLDARAALARETPQKVVMAVVYASEERA